MKRQEFLDKLKIELEKCGAGNTQEILSDYQEHFDLGLSNGKSEEEISEKLGNPATIAKAFEAEHLINRAKAATGSSQFALALKVLGRLVIIAPLNFFMFLIPGIVIFSLLFAGWSVALAIGTAALALLGAGIKAGLLALSAWLGIALISGSLGILGLAFLAAMVLFVITKYTLLSLLQYLQWNLKFVLEK